ncbi:hypothetical protein PoB_003568700 [Plakobranchus ocellatus]|uniref:Uncharacterized protein n=1 Tax=Plakobranchus ocellatus TaxID=259542 RepID=A0AAV4AQG8_9GAST|nr:hypothetical protein PoB_003568700 [Plakobranchus ocellatus]
MSGQLASTFLVMLSIKQIFQCDLCISYKQGNCKKKKYDDHIARKLAAQAEKKCVKEMTDDTTSVWTMDVQSVLPCPRTKASSLFYRTKLVLHNMTYCNLKTKEGYCYVFDETHRNVSNEMFGWLHHSHFTKYCEKNPTIMNLIIFSDDCGYQNKCCSVANSLVQLALERDITVEQKYLVSGHTQMECDSMQLH